MTRRVVLLDRDGVINADSDAFITRPGLWRPLPGSLEAIASLHAGGWQVAVCTNQSGLARGLLDEATLEAIHRRMEAAVRAAGGRLAGIYVCPHGPDSDCTCRKPRPGLLQAALRDLQTEPAAVPVIGDSLRDLQAARAAGTRPILVRTGNGERTLAELPAELSDVPVFADLAAAARHLLEEPWSH